MRLIKGIAPSYCSVSLPSSVQWLHLIYTHNNNQGIIKTHSHYDKQELYEWVSARLEHQYSQLVKLRGATTRVV